MAAVDHLERPPIASPRAADDEPLRAALYSSDQMVAHGKRLAAQHVLAVGAGPDRLLARLRSNERVLVGFGRTLAAAAADGGTITPAAEWLLDNLYLIEEEIRTARRHLPKGYSRELPRLAELGANGRSGGLPRVYDIALEAIAHSDGRLGRGTLTRFVEAYQSVQALDLGELWALPIMLRLALIDNLRRASVRVAEGRAQRELAGEWARRMVDVADRAPSSLILEVADMARSGLTLTSAFVAEFTRRLQGQGAALALALTWVEQHLGERGLTIEQLVHEETQAQAAAQVSVANSIGSLRLLGATDWSEFVETLSGVEALLRQDPADVYGRMDFATRDACRHAVEHIAQRARRAETEVARAALDLATAALAAAVAKPHDPRERHVQREAHVGHYLIGSGRPALEARLGLRTRWWHRPDAQIRTLWLYGVAVLGGAALLSAAPLEHAVQALQPGPVAHVGLALLLLLATSPLSLAFANWLVTLFVPPRALPRMDHSMGISRDMRALVVVPTLLGDIGDVDDLVEGLERRYLANRDAQLQFALLTDFPDAPQEHMPGDDALVALAAARIAALNATHRPPTPEHEDALAPFLLLHRHRRFNGREGVWMGWERKRGKLADLNALLRGRAGVGPRECFSHVEGDMRGFAGVRYVITLDTDTQLPRDSAAAMVAAMAHPLNRPRFGSGRRAGTVVEGYGILQPRVSLSLESTMRSGYARLFGGEPGIDPYTRATSDVYQDLFGEGSFIGKGIYDVDAFEQALQSTLPENRILSHDLLEGCYVRAGLLSDVELVEEAPTRHAVDAARRHRWTRGDWQLTGWLRARLRLLPGRPRNPLSPLSQWKIFDNLRRSLATPALLLLLLLGWLVLPDPDLWTLRALAILGLVPFAAQMLDWLRRPIDWLRPPGSPHGNNRLLPAGRQLTQWVHGLALLPHEALQNLDAVIRTLWRLVATRRRLLEWTAYARIKQRTTPGTLRDFAATVRALWATPALACATALALWRLRPEALLAAAPVLVLWLCAPALVWWFDRPPAPRRARLDAEQVAFLRRQARRTWEFFATFVHEGDHHLPPDNVQQHPVPRVAHRTSPTNIGFALLANVSAYESGWLHRGGLLQRCEGTIGTLEKLERHRGHFLNWYDTRTLQPLRPRYVSTVDSGNLAACLLTLRSALTTLADAPVVQATWWQGLADTLAVARETLEWRALDDTGGLAANDAASGAAAAAPLLEALVALQARAEVLARQHTQPLSAWAEQLQVFEGTLTELVGRSDGVDADRGEHGYDHSAAAIDVDAEAGAPDAPRHWLAAARRQCRALQQELAPWLSGSTQGRIDGDSHTQPHGHGHGVPTLATLAAQGDATAIAQTVRIEALAARVAALEPLEYGFLYDSSRHLLHIGFNLDERMADTGHYDLLASEVRLTILVAIAQGRLPQESWFALGRLLASVGGEPVLMSWSGSMFEYLMPALLTPQYEGTLLDQTCRGAVRRQVDYGQEHGVAWGISESGYHATDAALNYQYRAFGVPGLGLKRGLAEDLVIAPYASMLALLVEPELSCRNLQRLAREGATGRFGFHEAVDYTRSRVPTGQRSAVVRSFMAHHQGMGLLALQHVLQGPRMQQHFARDIAVQSTLLLLQERVPKVAAPRVGAPEPAAQRASALQPDTPTRTFTDPDTPTPEVHLLSNGRYHVMLTAAGGGYSRCRDMAVTRWVEDTTCDAAGTFCWLRDVDSGEVWSTAYQPTRVLPTNYSAILSEGKAEFRRRDHGIDTHLEIAVSPEDDIELRRLRVKNGSRRKRTIEITSGCEVVLATPAADAQHPAFNKLFVQTEVIAGLGALLCHRRPRAPTDAVPWSLHLMAAHAPRTAPRSSPHDAQRADPWSAVSAITHESDRSVFIGRGGSLAMPLALRTAPGPLSNTAGAVLDPVAASRCTVTLEPDEAVSIDMVMGMADDRARCLALIEKYRDRRLADRVFELAWTHAQVLLRQLNASESEAQAFARLAGAVLYPQTTLRADPALMRQNRRSQSGLWGYAISGDLPIVLLRIAETENLELVRQLVLAHAWWRLKGLAVDLVIWNEERDIYRQGLQEQIMGLIAAGVEAHGIDKPGGIFVRHADQIAQEDKVLLQSVARVLLSDQRGTLLEQIERRYAQLRAAHAAAAQKRPALALTRPSRRDTEGMSDAPGTGLQRYNGFGGFAPDGREYVVDPAPGQPTPAPWCNVIANPRLGTVISEAGAAYTWCENAHEFRLTPWFNDPVCDPSGERYYVRDEESGRVWPATGATERRRRVRHGFGYSVFEQVHDGIRSTLTVFVAAESSVKFARLELRNLSGRPRRLSATGYVEWVLGDLRQRSAPHIVTERSGTSGALLARNPFSNDFSSWVAFFDVDEAWQRVASTTCDRGEFIGRNGSAQMPAALRRATLGEASGAGLDPCAAISVPFELGEDEAREVVFRLGVGRDRADAEALVQRFRGDEATRAEWAAMHAHWERTLGAVQVRTPDAAFDLLANGWLTYQAISCRLWARSGYYQSGGAYGFRDQLQDTMALVLSRPDLLRAQLLTAASRQFPEGDVQHWWHPPGGRGVRTAISDDFLWLPLALTRYLQATGDNAVLAEKVPFIEGRELPAGDESYFDLPGRSGQTATLYEHARRAVKRGWRFGPHGLPLIGAGDWNDGMNRIGHHGQGESVWLGFFQCVVLQEFAGLARRQGDEEFALECERTRAQLAQQLEAEAWDGGWYRRAWFDDGTPLGSAENSECRIDSIAQSWSVLSDVASPERARTALAALSLHLVDRPQRIVRLLDPPFNGAGPNPGYIAGYLPGVRENGGQYTHGALWAAMAYAHQRDAAAAYEILDLINPIGHARTAAEAAIYKVEPYVVAADVYGVAPHVGRGGWSWYTGSAGWMLRLMLESILGLVREHDGKQAVLHLQPLLPPQWDRAQVRLRHGKSRYDIEFVRAARGEAGALWLDGAALADFKLPLVDDGGTHAVRLLLG